MDTKRQYGKRVHRLLLSTLLLLVLLTSALLLSGCGGSKQSVKAPDTDAGKCGANVEYEFNGTLGRLTVKGSGDMTDFESGSKAPWAEYAPAIKKLVIEVGITSIGDYAFYYCTSLESVNIESKDLVSIGKGAFWMNRTLPEIEIPATVTEIGSEAFAYCTSLQSISAESLASIGTNAFKGCTALELASLNGSLTEIPAGVFANCTALKTVATGESVTKWSDTALENTENVEKTVIQLVGKLTIKYVDADGNELAPAHVAEYAKDSEYSVTTPTVEGYTIPAGKNTISGTMPGADLEIKVVYVKNAEESIDSSDATEESPSGTTATGGSEEKSGEDTPIIFLVLLVIIVIAIVVGAVLLVRSGQNVTKDSATVRKSDSKKNAKNGKRKKK